jgi:hypothetical protein
MVTEINGVLVNYPILLNKYMDRCVELTSDPAETLKFRMGLQ